MSTENNNQEHDFSIPPTVPKTNAKRKVKKGWIIFAIIVLLIVVALYFAKPFIVDYLNDLFETIGHPDGPAYPID